MQTLFIIDDNPDVLSVTLTFFAKKGYETVGATNGLDALQMLRKVNPDLIITDIMMPQMDGFKLLKELKSSPLTSKIPILVISGHGQMIDSFQVLGIEGFLTKPFSTSQLLQKVHEILVPPEPVEYE
jgi:CheY-like chemotaxis protein